MRERTVSAASRSASRRATISIDVVLLTPLGKRLAALLRRQPEPRGRERWALPWDAPRGEESVGDAAVRIARAPLGAEPAWLEQIGAFGDGRRHPGDAELSIGFVALAPAGSPALVGGDEAWFPLDELPSIPPRHRAVIDGAVGAIHLRLDQAPIAFRLLPPTFTLTELQEIYEILLGRRLHKASFRRSLQAAWLVEPTEEWRSEGRGRPAQLYRFAPRKRRTPRRAVRFDLLGG